MFFTYVHTQFINIHICIHICYVGSTDVFAEGRRERIGKGMRIIMKNEGERIPFWMLIMTGGGCINESETKKRGEDYWRSILIGFVRFHPVSFLLALDDLSDFFLCTKWISFKYRLRLERLSYWYANFLKGNMISLIFSLKFSKLSTDRYPFFFLLWIRFNELLYNFYITLIPAIVQTT